MRFRTHRKKAAMTIPVAMVAGFMPFGMGIWGYRSSPTDMASFASQALTGYNPAGGNFTTTYLKQGLFPIAAGTLVHIMASKLGINRLLGRARIPFVRI